MITQKEFSGVYFGPAKRLKEVLDGLVNDGFIEDYAYICHKAETEEKKEHLHFWASPLKRVDCAKLRKKLNCEEGGSLPMQKSKFPDWLLYGLHDRNYLAIRGLVKVHHYELFEVISTFPIEQLQHLREEAYDEVFPRWNVLDYVKSAVENRISWSDILTSGIIPPNQYAFYKEVFNNLCSERKQREEQTNNNENNNQNNNQN